MLLDLNLRTRSTTYSCSHPLLGPTTSQKYVSVLRMAPRLQFAILNRKGLIPYSFKITSLLICKSKCHISFPGHSEGLAGIEIWQKKVLIWKIRWGPFVDFFFNSFNAHPTLLYTEGMQLIILKYLSIYIFLALCCTLGHE